MGHKVCYETTSGITTNSIDTYKTEKMRISISVIKYRDNKTRIKHRKICQNETK